MTDSEAITTETAKTYEYKLIDEKLKKLCGKDSISIYDNDLKYKSHNTIDLQRVKDLPKNEMDKDTLEYRIEECKNNDYKLLDLSHLKLQTLPKLSSKIKKKLQYLFLSENELEFIENLNYFEDLIVIDLCNNKLNALPELPYKIEELLIKNNVVQNIDELSKYDYLKRLDCCNNNIHVIPMMNSLEILKCDNNLITSIPKLENMVKLSCANNKIEVLNDMPNLEIMDCEKNNIQLIENYKNLRELYCSKNDLFDIKNINKIIILHCHKTNLTKIEYYNELKELVCDHRENLLLSKHYTIIESHVYSKCINLLHFK